MTLSMSHGDVRKLAGKLMAAGFHVFPTLHKKDDINDKKPAGGEHGFYEATSDPETFEALLRSVRIGAGWHLGLGVYPGASGHIVLDPDVKDGGRGLQSLARIESVYGPLPARRVRTPSGGEHDWMKLPDGFDGEIGNRKVDDWSDIDIRCHKGYVIAPGTTVPWGAWIPESGEIGVIPAEVLHQIEAAQNEPKVIPEVATPGDRHETLVSLAASMWAKGLERASVLAAIRGYNQEQCDPPKPDSELVDIVEWVVQQEGGPTPGWQVTLNGKSLEAAHSEADGPRTPDSHLPLYTAAELCARVDAAGPRLYLVRGLWPAGAYGVNAAEMKAQKSWDAFDLVVSVASHTPWLDHFDVDDPGPVIVFAGEGGEASIVRRLRAICRSRGVHLEDLPVYVCTRAPHLRKDDHMAVLTGHVADIRPKLVVIDPLYLSAGGAKGGDLYGMGELLERPQLVCDAYGSALVVVTHFNRGNKSGAERITGAGPAEWGRVLVGSDVKSRHTDPDTKATTVVKVVDVIGGEVPDTTFRIKRRIWADNPDDLDSALNYEVEVLDEDESEDLDMPPARRKLLEAIRAVGEDGGRPSKELVDWIADKYGHGLTRQTVSEHLNELLRQGYVDAIETPGSATLWLPKQGVADVVTTPSRHQPTGVTGGVSSASSRLYDDDTPTPRKHPSEVSPPDRDLFDTETEKIAP